jgi:phosphatidylserine decarboxylase
MLLHADVGLGARVPLAFVAIGAMLVGSILWSKKPGERVRKGEELGWFQYGGSTCVLVVPHSSGLKFDEDLVKTSQKRMETLVQVGTSMGHIGRPRGTSDTERRV